MRLEIFEFSFSSFFFFLVDFFVEEEADAETPLSACAEGPWDEVMRVIGQCHAMLHQQGIVRIQSDIRVGSRYVRASGTSPRVLRFGWIGEGSVDACLCV